MGRGRRRPAAAANPTARLDRAAERQHLERVSQRAEEIDDEVEELQDTWAQFEEERQQEVAAGRPDMGDKCLR